MYCNAAIITVFAFLAFIIAYHTYGRFIATRIFRLDPKRITPSHELQDGIDFVPTRVPILFGHHFASIAGLGPILGPAIAVIWGWVPAVIWVVLGSIFIGAVHDLGALTLSMNFKGRTIGDICRDLIGPRARMLALLIIFFLMSLAMGAFVNAIAALFVAYNPDAIIPSVGLMAVAVVFGISVYKFKVSLLLATVVGLSAFAGLILWGVEQPILTHEWFASPETQLALGEARDAETALDVPRLESPYGSAAAEAHFTALGNKDVASDIRAAVERAKSSWIGVLLFYGFVASVLPVWLLLQPRDYINSFQLYFALSLMTLGLIVAAVMGHDACHINAPMFRTDIPFKPGDTSTLAPSWLPLLFVTVACGAVSGFHALVSSGTTVRQINSQTDALPIGYGAMLVEGALAILVIMACVAGLGAQAWGPSGTYSTWESADGLAAKLSAVVHGGANFFNQVGIPVQHGRAVLAVTVVAFALTTLDSATRLLRFNVEEIGRSLRLKWLANRYAASLIAVAGIAFFGLVPGRTALWTLFGSTNQLLAGLTLLTVSVFLFKLHRPVRYTIVPMIFMLALAVWALAIQLYDFFISENWPLVAVTVIVLVMSAWLTVEALLTFARGREEDEQGSTGS